MLGALTGGQIQGGYDQLCNCIIRPARCEYTLKDLGPNRFRAGGVEYTRTDFELRNPRGLKIQASHYEPAQGYRPKPKLPCVIYLHGNCGSRLDGIDALELLLPYNITVVTLDFTGSGISEGDYVSLGFYEKEDLRVVVDHLRTSGNVTRIGLWGRSMGAATAILYAHQDPSIAGMVLDSGFASLSMLARELAEQSEFKVPKMVVSIALKMIRKSIKSRAGFDIEKLEPIKYVDSCFVPALFAHGNGDSFIQAHHSKELYERYSGDKNIVFFEGDHNTRRPEFFFDSVSIFFHNTLLVDEDKDLVNHILRQTAPKSVSIKAVTGPSNEDLENDLLQQALLLSMQEVQPTPEMVKQESKPELKTTETTYGKSDPAGKTDDKPPTHGRKLSFSEDRDRNLVKQQSAGAVEGNGRAGTATPERQRKSSKSPERRRKSSKSPDKDHSKRISTMSPEREKAANGNSTMEKRATWGGFLRAVSPGRRLEELNPPAPAAAAPDRRSITKDDKKR